VLAVSLAVGLRGIHGAWWGSADPDGAYVGSGLNILLGNHTNYLDHPGLPTQDALALAFGGQYLFEKATGREDAGVTAFVDARMLDLDATRWIYRTWAVFLFVGGALLAAFLTSRLLAHWSWGVAAGLLFVTAPGLWAIASLLRPDSGLAAVCLAAAYLLATAIRSRSAIRYIGAALILGVAVSFKLTAIGLVPALLLSAVAFAPPRSWTHETAGWVRRTARRHTLWLLPTAAAWLALCVVFDRKRLPLVATSDARHLLVNGGTILGGYLLLASIVRLLRVPWAEFLFDPFYGVLALALVVGFAIPASLILNDGIQAAVTMWDALRGRGVNAGVEPFGQFYSSLFIDWPIPSITIVFVLAVIGALVHARRGCWWPLALTLGAFTLTALAAARLSTDYYYAPAYAVAILPALASVRRRRSSPVPAYAWAAVALAVVPTLLRLPPVATNDGDVNIAAQDLAGHLVTPGESVILTPFYFPVADVRFDDLVRPYVVHTPDFPYRFLEANHLDVAAARGLTPRYYVARVSDLASIPEDRATTVTLDGKGPFVVRRLPRRWGPQGAYGLLAILHAPRAA
jgi:hypothetical protein